MPTDAAPAVLRTDPPASAGPTLTGALFGLLSTPPTTAQQQVRRRRRGRWALLVLGAAAVLVCALGVVLALTG